MATVRLEFDLDSDVYPELYAALAGIRSARARAERVRQLAASGLVWENVRVYGAAAIGPTPIERVPVERAPVEPPPPVVEPVPVPERVRARARPAPAPRRTPPPRSADFVDLAIDAAPPPDLPVVRELPVLMDVVPDDVVEDSRPGALLSVPVPVPVLDDVEPAELPAWARSDVVADDDEATLPADPPPVTPLAEKPHTRSRLMRMKERGLFKNG
ncbi:MAG: hypothetical protein ABW067_15540 [Rhizobacter sp.]